MAEEGLEHVSVCTFYIFSSQFRLSLWATNGRIVGYRDEFNRGGRTDEHVGT
jgi:hypothetical protein